MDKQTAPRPYQRQLSNGTWYEITDERIRVLQDADAIYISELRKSNQYDKIWQAFAVLLPVRTVGVMGDART